jgi:hypothetical protein
MEEQVFVRWATEQYVPASAYVPQLSWIGPFDSQ